MRDRRLVSGLMVAAAQALTEDRQQSLDDNRWFRHDWDVIQRYKDGLTLDAQGLPELTTALAKLLPGHLSKLQRHVLGRSHARSADEDRGRVRDHCRP